MLKAEEAIRATDPLHAALRWKGDLTPRHPYSVTPYRIIGTWCGVCIRTYAWC